LGDIVAHPTFILLLLLPRRDKGIVNRGNGGKMTRAPLWTDETGPSNIGIV
jgi:hypothetical protein